MVIPAALLQHFQEEGYCVLERVIPESDLAGLGAECQRQLDLQMESMERVAADTLGLSQKQKRYFLPPRYEESPVLDRFLFSDYFTDIVRAFVGDQAYPFQELFVVKWPGTGTAFGWHQDSGFLMGNSHRPFASLWCALDDMTESNGALSVLPYSRAGSRDVVPHVKDKQTGDLVCYDGADAGIVLRVPKGSIVVLSSTIFHCSGTNSTAAPRRVFLASFAPEPISDRKGNRLNRAVPFLADGKPVTSASSTV